MLTSLFIRDFALIDELEIPFHAGLNVITGQTGAGKSILIGALNMVLGGRADGDVIRNGAQKAVAEATFQIGKNEALRTLLAQHDIETGATVLLRREIKSGGSRAFVNDTPVPVQFLREVGEWLVDLHGQHDHQQLLREDRHRPFLDQFNDVSPALAVYQDAFGRLSEAVSARSKLLADRRSFTEKLEIYRLHAADLDAFKLDEEEEERLRAEMRLLDNAEDLARTTASILDAGSDGEQNAMTLLRQITDGLALLQEFDADFKSYAEEVKAATISISEMLNQVEQFKTTIAFDPKRLDAIRERLTDLRNLQRRFNRTVPEMVAYRAEIAAFLAAGDSFEDRLDQLNRKVDALKKELSAAAAKLHSVRKERGAYLSQGIREILAEVGIPNAVFAVDLVQTEQKDGWITTADGKIVEATPFGGELVRFLISTNRGEDPKPLAKIASGGEISRVMLALKSIMAREQSLPVMVFDEIDTGISGAVSEKVGRVMRQLSRTCQILTITHQAQIGCQADHHFRVEKVERNERTTSSIRELTPEERIDELAILISGEVVTEAARESARQMITRAKG